MSPRLLPTAAVALALAGCGAASVRVPDATLVVACPDPAAQLYVDEGYAGLAAATRGRPLPLAAGTHRIELRADGKIPAYREVTLARGEAKTVRVALHPDPEQAP